MSVIADLLNQIKTAVYGRDVRQAIHDAIQQCYLDSTEGITPVITTETVSGGHNIKITVGADTTTVYVANGENGQNGQNGTNGQNGQDGTNGVGSLPDGTYTAQEIHTSGTLTSNGTYVIFFIPFVDAVNRTITITPTKISVRDRGNYLANSLTTGVTYEYVLDATGILVKAIKSDGWGGENNSVVSVQFFFDLTVEGSTQDISESLAQIQTNKEDISQLKADLDAVEDDTEEIGNKVTALEFNGGVTPAVKNALLACFLNVAWKDAESGSSCYQDLEDALYPTTTLRSITAVYTQSSVVYADTPLDDLKSDLVVTAHYTNGTTSIVPASYYTLTGILAVGTSTVSVSYVGKSTTFSVTVTAALYPFENGTHNFTNPAGQITVSNGNTAVITASTANSNDTHANVSELSTNTTACNAAGNYTGISEPYFTIPAGSTLNCKATITKLVYPINTSNAALAFRDMSGTAVLVMFANHNLSNMAIGQAFSESVTVDSATDIGCVGLFLGRKANNGACEIGVKIEAYLDGVRII